MSEETTTSEVEVPTSEVKTEDTHDYAALIAESKKYRERAQKAEALNAAANDSAKAEADKSEKARRIKAGEQNAMLDEMQSKLDDATTFKEQYLKDQAVRIDSLRAQLPEDKRETYGHIKDPNLLQSLVDDFKVTGSGSPTDRSAVPKDDFGGFGSETEWANKDIAGYAKHRADAEKLSIKWGVVPEN